MLSFQNKKPTFPSRHIPFQAHLQERKVCLLYHIAFMRKRAALSASQEKGRGKGSLTMEAAVVLPVFLIALMTVLYTAKMALVQMTFIGPLHETAQHLAHDAYVYDAVLDENGWKESVAGELLTGALSVGAAKSSFVQLVGKDWIEQAGIEGGVSGLSFAYSKLPDDDDMIDLVLSYRMQAPFSLVDVPAVRIMQRGRVHAWVGYTPSAAEEEQTVYVTEHGTVYHLYLTCSHLQLSVREVSFSEIEYLRNENGAKYYPCEKCGAQRQATVYITEDGNRYHASLSCGGLKRGIREIPISEVGDLPLCSRCAAGG